jgi:hypothetical protein
MSGTDRGWKFYAGPLSEDLVDDDHGFGPVRAGICTGIPPARDPRPIRGWRGWGTLINFSTMIKNNSARPMLIMERAEPWAVRYWTGLWSTGLVSSRSVVNDDHELVLILWMLIMSVLNVIMTR